MTHPTYNEKNLIWIDLEMTGLDPLQDKIIEIAVVITNTELDVIAEGPELVVKQPKEILDAMDKWNQEQHSRSGLIERVLKSTYSEQDAATETLNFIKQYVPPKSSPMCGSSICQDRRFLSIHMQTLEDYFHYRHLDVSTIKILAQRWSPDIAFGVKKKNGHRAKMDILESIQELRYYKDKFLKLPS